MTDIHDFQSEKSKRRGNKGIPKARLINDLCKYIRGVDVYGRKWSHGKFYVYKPDSGENVLLHETRQGIVKVVANFMLEGAILKEVNEIIKTDLDYDSFSLKDAMEAVKSYLRITDPAEISIFAEYGSKNLAFNRMPFEVPRGMDYIWEKWYELAKAKDEQNLYIASDAYYMTDFLYRVKFNRIALATFIWSIFEPKSFNQQYLYMYGRGADGKGTILNMLNYILKDGYEIADPKFASDPHWTENFVGKRVIAFADTDSPAFAQSGMMKTLTGGDAITINVKHKTRFKADINAKFIFASNEKLQIDKHSYADLRRAIYAEMDGFTGDPIPSDEWEKIIKNEAPVFLSLCRYIYERELGGEHRMIKPEYENLFNVETKQDLYEIIASKLFSFPTKEQKESEKRKYNIDKDFKIKRSSFREKLMMDNPRVSNKFISDFKDWIEKEYGVKCDQKVGENEKWHIGVKEAVRDYMQAPTNQQY